MYVVNMDIFLLGGKRKLENGEASKRSSKTLNANPITKSKTRKFKCT